MNTLFKEDGNEADVEECRIEGYQRGQIDGFGDWVEVDADSQDAFAEEDDYPYVFRTGWT